MPQNNAIYNGLKLDCNKMYSLMCAFNEELLLKKGLNTTVWENQK
jgi:hypothetical protein